VEKAPTYASEFVKDFTEPLEKFITNGVSKLADALMEPLYAGATLYCHFWHHDCAWLCACTCPRFSYETAIERLNKQQSISFWVEERLVNRNRPLMPNLFVHRC